MADRPIMFSAPMVRALLAGRKTQTRRLLKVQPPADLDLLRGPDECGRFHWTNGLQMQFWPGGLDHPEKDYRPPYAPGDRLWVREAWRTQDGDLDGVKPAEMAADTVIFYDADHPSVPSEFGSQRSRPSIHMPRWASRLTLIVDEVRVQRLQDISQLDAFAEGAERHCYGMDVPMPAGCESSPSYKVGFVRLWNSLHGDDAWDANSWVVAVSFDVQRGNIDALGLE